MLEGVAIETGDLDEKTAEERILLIRWPQEWLSR